MGDSEKEGRFAWKSTQNGNAVLLLETFSSPITVAISAPDASSAVPPNPESSSVAPASSSAYVSPWDAKMVDLFHSKPHGKELPFIIEVLARFRMRKPASRQSPKREIICFI
ncbi:MAG: hypothetical protein IJ787_03305 [Bacilli bacterium]|nr:hypothetical protein [Bacilli bacterium]